MKRLSVHSLLFIVLVSLAFFAIWQFMSLRTQHEIETSLAEIPISANASDPIPDAVSSSDHARLAWANALSAGGELSAAEAIYGELINQSSGGDIALAAEYNLANAYLREGTKTTLSGNRRRALLSLSKQRYRDLLKQSPDNWDARYNLERALRLAPEIAGLGDAKGPPVKSVDVVVPDFMLKALP